MPLKIVLVRASDLSSTQGRASYLMTPPLHWLSKPNVTQVLQWKNHQNKVIIARTSKRRRIESEMHLLLQEENVIYYSLVVALTIQTDVFFQLVI